MTFIGSFGFTMKWVRLFHLYDDYVELFKYECECRKYEWSSFLLSYLTVKNKG